MVSTLGKNQDIRRAAFDSGGSRGRIHGPALCSLQRWTVFPGATTFVFKVSSWSTESNATLLWQRLFYLPFSHGRALWSFKIIQNNLSLLNSKLKFISINSICKQCPFAKWIFVPLHPRSICSNSNPQSDDFGGGGALSTNYIRRVHGVSALIKESKPWEWASSLRRVDTARRPPKN